MRIISNEEIANANRKLIELVTIKEDKFNLMIKAASILTKLFAPYTRLDARPIIVGGLSVEIYTRIDYNTRDIDFVTSSSILFRETLEKLNFKKNGHIFYRDDLELAIDVVDNFLAGSQEKVATLKLEDSEVYVISIEDIILDRLHGHEHSDCYKWGAILLSLYHEVVDLDYIKTIAIKSMRHTYHAFLLRNLPNIS